MGQSVWWCVPGLEKYNSTNADIQNASSIGHRDHGITFLMFIGLRTSLWIGLLCADKVTIHFAFRNVRFPIIPIPFS